jgi:long-chain acyl-CoA synthetase
MADSTLTRMFWSRVENGGDRPAQLVKRGGRWQTLTWSEVGGVVRELALGLVAAGVQRGDAVALLSASRAEWVQADMAILSAGGVTAPVYATYPPELIAHIVNDAGTRTLIVENPAQLEKVLEVKGKMPGLERVVVIEGYEGQAPFIWTWDQLRRLGRDNAEALKSDLAGRVTSVRPDDVATIVYTSGTTGPPKGVVQTHANHMAALAAVAEVTQVRAGEVHLLFLPLAHSFARLEAFMGVHVGLATAFAESLDTVAADLREVRPHFFCSVPRFFDKVYAKILAGIEGGSPLKQRIFFWALGVGRDVSRLRQAGQPIPATLGVRHRFAHRLVFARLHEALGGRLRFAVSGGAPLALEIAEFFHAVGILILEGYGLTETCPVLTFNRIDRFKFGSVGQAIPGVELKIAADGEILARGANVATRGYLNQSEATAEAFGPDGWFHTGDIGRVDDDGFLYITDRKKDIIVTAGGANIAPQNIENLLRSDPLVSQAMVYGDRRPYPVALITLNPTETAKVAGKHGLLVTDHAALTRHPAVIDRVGRIVEAKNAALQSYARIKRFAVLPVDFTESAGELTPTQKIKRKVVAARYGDVLESLYESREPAAAAAVPGGRP